MSLESSCRTQPMRAAVTQVTISAALAIGWVVAFNVCMNSDFVIGFGVRGFSAFAALAAAEVICANRTSVFILMEYTVERYTGNSVSAPWIVSMKRSVVAQVHFRVLRCSAIASPIACERGS